ncbi:MAG: complex I NDUFA9 subunit family protein [Rhodobacteraceae bacterium]|jgi:NADH dehydrogenase|nr:complex I NDUFA9 subunit family protein [Paracoccaceae bacterium]
MSQLVTIFGGSGFIGRYVARRLARDGWRVRVAVRRPNEALFVRTYGVVGQVEPVFANIRDDASVAAALSGADAVVNCVGVLAEDGRNTFDAVQAEGAERIARLAAEAGIVRFVQLSAIGADPESDSKYARTKAAGEAAVLRHVPSAVILRPSIVFGTEDQFFNRFASMTRMSPVLPLVGAETRFQPVYVDDVAKAATMGVLGTAQPGVYELGGPEIASFRSLMRTMLDVIRRRRMIVGLPLWLGRAMGAVFDFLGTITVGLVKGPITRDQARNLARDNVVSPGAKGLDDLGIVPVAMEAVLPDYLWRFRPAGQYSEIQQSARNLRRG